MSNHTRSSPEDRRVDLNDKGETERLRRENTELQIIIDDLRETIRMQASKLEQGSNGASQSDDKSHPQIVELQEFVHSLEENLQHMADQNKQLEITQGELRAEIVRLQKSATMTTNESDVQDKELYQQQSKPQSENDVEHTKTHEITISESENQHMKEEFERVKALCTALEQEKDSLMARIKELQDCIDRSSKTVLTHGKSENIITVILSKPSNLQVVSKISDLKQQLDPKHSSSTDLEKLSDTEDTEDTPDKSDQATKKQLKASELIDSDDPSTIPEAPLSPMFTLGKIVLLMTIEPLPDPNRLSRSRDRIHRHCPTALHIGLPFSRPRRRRNADIRPHNRYFTNI